MNSDIKNWLNHVNKSNKRKRDDTDDIFINELTCSCIDNLLEIIKYF